MLRFLRPACLLLQNVARVAQRDRVWLFSDVEPFFVPVIERRVPWAVQVLGFHAVMEVEVYTPGYLRTTASFLPQTEKMAEKIEMGLEAAICFAEMYESGDKEDRVGMQIANPNLVVKTEPGRKGCTGTPNSRLKKSSNTTISPGCGSGYPSPSGARHPASSLLWSTPW